MNQQRFNYLVDIVAKIKHAVNRMNGAYEKFPSLIDQEHKMILDHTYTKQLEDVCAAKETLAEEITLSFEDLQQLSHQVYLIWSEIECEGKAIYPGDLSNCITMVRGILETVESRGAQFSLKNLNLILDDLDQSFLKFKETAYKVKPKIELNRSSLSGVVKSYQDSTRFLIEMCEQSQATYSSQGTQTKSSSGTSTIYVRA